MNEHALARRFHQWIGALVEAGAPIWSRKIHGNQYQRDIPDRLFCIGGHFAAIELKNPDDPKPPTAGQARELAQIAAARGSIYVTHDLVQAQGIVRELVRQHAPDWVIGPEVWPVWEGAIPSPSSSRRKRIRIR